MKTFLLAIALILAAAFPAAAQDSEDAAPKVTARLVAEQTAVAPGGSVTIALEEKIRPEWHTYWVNPGDAGSPTTIDWTLPPGWKAGPIQWPTPKRLPVLSLMDYGYEGTLWLLSSLTAPADAKPGDTITLKAAVSWLVCKNICVPEDTVLTLPVKISAGAPDPAVAKQFADARALLPVASPWKLTYESEQGAAGKTLDLYISAPALTAAHPVAADFFPLGDGVMNNAAPQIMGFAQDGLVLRLAPGAKPPAGPLQGVLVLKSSDGSVQALNVDAPPGAVPSADFAAPAGSITLALALAFAFLGGLILNVMPCVLPILAMKALALAGHAGRERREVMMESFSYSAGAVLSFLAFGLAVVGLRAGGAEVGWGFQLQEPVAVACFSLLMFAVALNLLGLFEVGSVSAGGSLAAKGGFAGAFFTGVLAVAVAAPCTAPFMAAALGFALTQSTAIALLVFLALGLGFALPFLVLGVWPRALSFLPKPGPWMLRLKHIMAIPMAAAGLWLGWVLWLQVGTAGALMLAESVVAITAAALLWRITRDRPRALNIAGTFVAGALAIGGLYHVTVMPSPVPAAVNGGEGFSQVKLDALRAAHKPVFVDATAAWCITCLVNEKAVLSQPDVRAAFAAKGVTYMVADWTNRNAEIARLLDANGRSGVPLYLYYAPGAATPVILPQILTANTVLAAID